MGTFRKGIALALLAQVFGTAACLAEQSVLQDPQRITDIAVGIFCRDGVGFSKSTDPGTIKGTVDRMDRVPNLVMETQVVPAIDKIMFGVLAREKVENGTVLITVTHPPLGPQGLTVESWNTQMETGKHTVHAYYLGLSDGDPRGRWTITGASDDGLLFYAEFDVVTVTSADRDPCL
jgi:hypothetical protein